MDCKQLQNQSIKYRLAIKTQISSQICLTIKLGENIYLQTPFHASELIKNDLYILTKYCLDQKRYRNNIYLLKLSSTYQNTTSRIIYQSTSRFQNSFSLAQMHTYHIHVNDFQKYMYFMGQKNHLRLFLNDVAGRKGDISQGNYNTINIIKMMNNLPYIFGISTKMSIMKKHFDIDQHGYKQINKLLNKELDITFSQFITLCKDNGYYYRYLPRDLLAQNTNQNHEEHQHKQDIRDKVNPNLPNILVIVTPGMIEEYEQFGSLVGFDLTFSVIRQRSQSNGEYMMGVFAGYNNYRKIIIFGIVITNSQTTYAYQYMFQQFFEIMGSAPEVIITDEEKSLVYSVSNLKKAGIYEGLHLLDMFHILRKFRKFRFQGDNFQLMKELIHAPNRIEYRKTFRQILKGLRSDKQRELLRNFDLNSDKYCYAQIDPKYVGMGISTNCNQFFHSLIKNDIPESINLVKAIQLVINLAERRRQYSNIPTLMKNQVDLKFNLPFMRKYKIMASDRLIAFIMKQLGKCPKLTIMIPSQENARNFHLPKNRDHYFIKSDDGDIYLVKKIVIKGPIEDIQKWSCLCELQQRCGYLCAHTGKVLLYLDQDFYQNINKRWFIPPHIAQMQLQKNAKGIKMKYKLQKRLYSLKNKIFANAVRRSGSSSEKVQIPQDNKEPSNEGKISQETQEVLQKKSLKSEQSQSNISNFSLQIQLDESESNSQEDNRLDKSNTDQKGQSTPSSCNPKEQIQSVAKVKGEELDLSRSRVEKVNKNFLYDAQKYKRGAPMTQFWIFPTANGQSNKFMSFDKKSRKSINDQ